MTSLILSALLLLMGAAYVAPAQQLVAEVYFVVEPQVIRNYMKVGYSKTDALANLKGDIKYYLFQVNEMYKSIGRFGIQIEVRQKALKIMDTNDEMFDDCKLIRHKDLQSDLALEVFKDWLTRTDAYNKIGYDIALVWTGYDIFGSSGNFAVTGYATEKAACDPKHSVAIVEFDGTFAGAITTAHELAHSLGSPHDETNACPTSQGYIMAPIGNPKNRHRWEFSSCTAQSIADYINSLRSKNNDCLVKTTASKASFSMSSQAGRDILNVEKICQRARKDTNSYFCAFTNFYNGESVKGDLVCQYIFCGEKDTSSCSDAHPSDGMVCDVNKRCKQGRCVSATFSTPSSVKSDCVFGDSKSRVTINKKLEGTCAQYVAKNGGALCYQHAFTEMCCESCGKLKTSIYGCKYGNRNKDCGNYEPYQICDNSRDACCATCQNYVGKRSPNHSIIPQLTLTPTHLDTTCDEPTEEIDPKLLNIPITTD